MSGYAWAEWLERVVESGKYADLSLAAKAVLVVLVKHCPDIRPGQARLGVLVGLRERAVRNALVEIEKAGLVVRRRCGRFPSRYELVHFDRHEDAGLTVSRPAPRCRSNAPDRHEDAGRSHFQTGTDVPVETFDRHQTTNSTGTAVPPNLLKRTNSMDGARARGAESGAESGAPESGFASDRLVRELEAVGIRGANLERIVAGILPVATEVASALVNPPDPESIAIRAVRILVGRIGEAEDRAAVFWYRRGDLADLMRSNPRDHSDALEANRKAATAEAEAARERRQVELDAVEASLEIVSERAAAIWSEMRARFVATADISTTSARLAALDDWRSDPEVRQSIAARILDENQAQHCPQHMNGAQLAADSDRRGPKLGQAGARSAATSRSGARDERPPAWARQRNDASGPPGA